MQNGIQIVHIVIEASVWIHVVLLNSFRFGTENHLERRKVTSRSHGKKFSHRLILFSRSAKGAPAPAAIMRNQRFTSPQKMADLLKPNRLLLVFCLPRHARSGRLSGARLRRAPVSDACS